MRFFSKPRKLSGWLAFGISGNGVCTAHIVRGATSKPEVRMARFFSTDRKALPDVLEKIGKDLKANNFNCSTLLGGGEYQTISVEAPAVPAEEMKTAVRWRLKDMLDFPVDKATIDVLDIPSTSGGRGHQIFAVAAHNSMVELRQNLFVDARIRMRTIDIPEMAQRNISALMEPEGRGVAMVSFGNDGGLLTVSFEGELYLSRRIDVTLEQLLDADADRRQHVLDKITLELQRSLVHFDRQYNFVSVAKLVVAPTGALGLVEFLASNLYMPVESLDLHSVLDMSAVPELDNPAEQQRFFMTLGAALRNEEQPA